MLQIEAEEEEKEVKEEEAEQEEKEEDAEVINALDEQVEEVAFDVEKIKAEAANDNSLEVKALNDGGNDDAPIDPNDEREFSVYSFDSADY